jgi:NAD(P)-dependent dehydrogenase (short-subunit alcohol dehydrogenase family)
MFEDLKGRVALVTGGATGIGGAISAAFGAAGMKVAVHYHAGSEAAQSVADRIRGAGGAAEKRSSSKTTSPNPGLRRT